MSTRYPPGPKDWMYGYRLIRRIRKEILDFYMQLARQYGDIVYMKLGPFHDYTVFHPDLVRETLVTKARSFHKMEWQRKVLAQWNGNSILLSEGDAWLRQRRLVQRAFHPQRFANYGRLMVESTKRLLDDWQKHAEGIEVEITKTMTDLTIAIIAQTMFGVDVTGTARQVGEAVAILNDVAMYELMYPIRLPDWVPTAWQRRKRWAMSFLDDFIRKLVRDRRASGEDRGDLLSMLLLAVDEEGEGGGMTDEQARNEAMTLLLAGHDTTAAGLSWIFYALARYPEVEARVNEEIEDGLHGRLPTASDLPQLAYTERVIKEVLRIWPPAVGVFARQAIEDIEIGGYPIKKGSVVRMLSYICHHDPRWFPDPERFDPDRFAPGNVEKIPQFAYFPFGGGPRVCVGNTFAQMEMTLIVASVLQHFRLSLAPGQGEPELNTSFSLRPKGGLRLVATQRTPATAGAHA